MFTIYANGELIYSPNNKTLLVTQPKLTLEMGKAGSLDFHIPPTHPFYEQLGRISTKVSVLEDEETELFRGRVLSNEREFHNIRSVFCEGDLSYLVDSVQKAEKFTGKTHALFRKIIAAHNARMTSDKQFTVGTIGIENRDIILTGQSDEEVNVGPIDYRQIVVNSVVDDWNTTYDFIQNSLIDYAGGYLRTRRVNGVTYIDLVTSYGTTATQEIQIDSNMLDFLESVSPEDLLTVLIPLGDDNLTIAEANHGSDELVDAAAVAKYGRIVRTQVFPNVNQASTLLENGQRYLANNINVPKTFTIQAVDLHLLNPDIQPIHVGDRVKIVSEAHDVTEYMVCTKIEYDLSNPANTVYTFGNPKQTLTDRYREDRRKSSDTYGPGGTGSSAASAATHDWHLVDETVAEALETAAANAEETSENKILEFFDEWVKWDPENADGHIDIGALYRRLFDDESLDEFDTAGINIDAPTGSVNIFSDHARYENDRAILNNNLGINLDAPAGRINIFTTASTADTNAESIAEIFVWAGTDEEGKLGSHIALNADVVSISRRLEAVEGVFTSITSQTATIGPLLVASGNIRAQAFFESGATPADRLTVQKHTHDFEVDNDGMIHIKGADITGADHSFNIADTKKYKDDVSAARSSGEASVTIDTIAYQTMPLYSSSNKTYSFTIRGTGSNNAFKDQSFSLDASAAYNAGVNSVDTQLYYNSGAASVTIDSVAYQTTPLYSSPNKTYSFTIRGTGSNNAFKDQSFSLDASAAYNAGVTAGENKFTAVSVTRQGTYFEYYPIGSQVTGYNRGNAYNGDLYYINPYSGNYVKYQGTLYFSGTAYTLYTAGSLSGAYYAGSSATYYTKS